MRLFLRFFLCCSLLAGGLLPAHAQQPVRPGTPPAVQQGEPPYRREFVYGITTNSNSGLIGGGSIRSSYYWKPDWFWFWQLEITEVKNRKEVRYQSPLNGELFVYGKSNYLYAIRPSFGLERVIFHKAAEEGVQVSALASAGPTIGLEVPYYIIYNYDPIITYPPTDLRKEPYDPAKHHLENIAGSASFLTGFDQAKPNFGFHARAGLAFEYGRYREGVAGLEAGAMLEAYTRRPILMPSLPENPQVFSGVYLTLFFGRRN